MIGTGTTGQVFRAVHKPNNEEIAVKVRVINVNPSQVFQRYSYKDEADNIKEIAKFEQEAAILRQLKHPNIVRYKHVRG